MRAITAVFTIELISILMVGCTGCLRTNPFCLRICVCTHVLSHVCVSVGISDILCRFSLGCYYCLAFCLSIWKSVLSGYLSSMATSSIISMGIKMGILSYTPNVEQWVFFVQIFFDRTISMVSFATPVLSVVISSGENKSCLPSAN